jgi:hypothetical protein
MINSDNIKDIKMGKSGRTVKLLYNKAPIQIHTATMYLPFGVKSVNKEWSNFNEYNIDCSLNGSDSETAVNFKNTMLSLDLAINNLVKENCNLFNIQPNQDFAYSSILRENGDYPKLMKLQLSRDKNGNFDSFIFNEKKEKVPINESNIEQHLCKGKLFKAIIECVKVWYYNGKVGTIWKVVQLKFAERPRYNSNTDNNTNNNNTNNNNTNNNLNEDNIYNKMMIIDA